MPFGGSIFLFRLFGINVRLHWSWLVVAIIQIQLNSGGRSYGWAAVEYLALFVIVLMHEFGHALACRSVGGKAENIILWPLGGIAFVAPPPRPGAVLWSIAAGPLVNVILVPVTVLIAILAGTDLHHFHYDPSGGLARFAFNIAVVNLALLIFNMLPIYPLDGGQIFQALLWFIVGRVKSLMIASVTGLIAAVVSGLFCLYVGEWWLVIMALFLGSQAVRGFRIARYLAAQERALREQASVERPAI